MAFRDDREALRAKGKVLEGEVERLRADLERTQRELAEHEAKDEHDEEELRRLRKEVSEHRKRLGLAKSSAGLSPRTVVVVLVAGLALAIPMFVGYLFVSPSGDDVSPLLSASVDPPAVAQVEPVLPAQPAAPIEPVHFGAVVLQAEGLDLEPGDGCVITANLVGSGDVAGVRVVCDTLIYDSKMAGGTEITSRSSHALQYELPDGGFRHLVGYQDVGMRTGPRPQLDLNTQEQRARIWRESGQPIDVRLYVDDVSSIRLGEGLAGRSARGSRYEPVHLRATVRSSGPHPAAFDAGCELLGRPHLAEGFDCRLMLRCGETIIYGAGTSGYNRCGAGARIEVADDVGVTREDSDPSVALRVPERRLTVEDERDGERWRAQLALDEDPRCNLDGRWSGWTMSAEAEEPLAVERREGEARVEGPAGAVDAAVELDCMTGEGVIAAGDARYEGRFGPGFATFIGRVDGMSFALRRARASR